jgi:hypothetical protein
MKIYNLAAIPHIWLRNQTFALVKRSSRIVLDDVVHALFDGFDNFRDMAVA